MSGETVGAGPGRAGPGGAAGFTTDGFIRLAEWLRFPLLEPRLHSVAGTALPTETEQPPSPAAPHGGDGWGGY